MMVKVFYLFGPKRRHLWMPPEYTRKQPFMFRDTYLLDVVEVREWGIHIRRIYYVCIRLIDN